MKITTGEKRIMKNEHYTIKDCIARNMGILPKDRQQHKEHCMDCFDISFNILKWMIVPSLEKFEGEYFELLMLLSKRVDWVTNSELRMLKDALGDRYYRKKIFFNVRMYIDH